MEQKEKYGVLFVGSDSETRFYYTSALKEKPHLSVMVSITESDINELVPSIDKNFLDFIILNSKEGLEYANIIQKLKDHHATFQSDMILLSDTNEPSFLFLAEEMGIKEMFPFRIEVDRLITKIDNFIKQRNPSNLKVKNYVYEFETAVKLKAIEKCNEILKTFSLDQYLKDNIDLTYLLGEYYILAGKFQEAYELMLRRSRGLDDKSNKWVTIKVLNCLAKALYHLGKFEEALVIYNQMSEKSPQNLGHKVNLGRTLNSLGRWKEAVGVLDQVIKSDPTHNDALVETAKAHTGLGKMNEAHSYLDRVSGQVEFAPIASFFNNRGVISVRKGDYRHALEFYRSALFFTTSSQEKVLFNIALCLFKQGKVQEAKYIMTELRKTQNFDVLIGNKKAVNLIMAEEKKEEIDTKDLGIETSDFEDHENHKDEHDHEFEEQNKAQHKQKS